MPSFLVTFLPPHLDIYKRVYTVNIDLPIVGSTACFASCVRSTGNPQMIWFLWSAEACFSFLSVKSSCRFGWISEIRVNRYKADYSHYYAWIAESLNTKVLQHFHQKIMTTYITSSTANDYYMPTYRRNRKPCKLKTDSRKPRTDNRKLKTDNRKLNPYDYFN